MRLLLAEDERELARALSMIFKHNSYSVDTVHNGDDALDYGLNGNYDGIVLDVMMPGKDGFQVLDEIRNAGITTPILMLTAKSTVEDRIEGLNLGADDYLIKPFDTGELLARVRAITRRKAEPEPKILTYGDLSLNGRKMELTGENSTVRLTQKEYQLLELMMSNPNTLISSEHLLHKIWGPDTDSDINIVWTYISMLRRKFKTVGANVEIKSNRNYGYCLSLKDA